MMNASLKFRANSTLVWIALFSFFTSSLFAQKDAQEKIDESIEVVSNLKEIEENTVPPSLLKKAEAVVIIPKLKNRRRKAKV